MAKRLYLDFDMTLIDTDGRFSEDFFRACRAAYAPEMQWYLWANAAARAMKDGCYTLERHAREIRCADAGLRITQMCLEKQMATTFGDMSTYVYEDVVPTLERARANGWEVALLSWGDLEWQMHKVRACGLLPYFEGRIHISEYPGEKDRFIKQHSGPNDTIIFVDDKSMELDAVHNADLPVTTWQINRPSTTSLEYAKGATPAAAPGIYKHRACTSLYQIEL
ncbi:MAG TPA: HAD family hydrolase [Candidatus Paceibacterota bacterium]|nr:HAD family hydrolase [Candidatus Paceibacterota bacterium]